MGHNHGFPGARTNKVVRLTSSPIQTHSETHLPDQIPFDSHINHSVVCKQKNKNTNPKLKGFLHDSNWIVDKFLLLPWPQHGDTPNQCVINKQTPCDTAWPYGRLNWPFQGHRAMLSAWSWCPTHTRKKAWGQPPTVQVKKTNASHDNSDLNV